MKETSTKLYRSLRANHLTPQVAEYLVKHQEALDDIAELLRKSDAQLSALKREVAKLPTQARKKK
jgi:hypothetical protein